MLYSLWKDWRELGAFRRPRESLKRCWMLGTRMGLWCWRNVRGPRRGLSVVGGILESLKRDWRDAGGILEGTRRGMGCLRYVRGPQE